VGGVAIVQRIVEALRPLVDELVVLTNDDTLERLSPELRLVYDRQPHAGVLPALAAGLEAAQGERCLAVACDMPFVSRPLFEEMLRHHEDVVIPRTLGYLEPMHAVYRREPVLAAIREALGRGEQRMISYFAAVNVAEIPAGVWQSITPDGRAFFNVNTPDDLTQAQRLAGLDPAAPPPPEGPQGRTA